MANFFFDFDDTITQYTEKFEELYNLNPTSLLYFDYKGYPLSPEEIQEGIRKVDEATVSLRAVPGAVSFIHEALRRGHKVTIITAKPIKYATLVEIWLDQRELAGLVPVIHVDKSMNKEMWLFDNGFKPDYIVEDNPMALYFSTVPVLFRLTRQNEAAYRRAFDKDARPHLNITPFRSYNELRRFI